MLCSLQTVGCVAIAFALAWPDLKTSLPCPALLAPLLCSCAHLVQYVAEVNTLTQLAAALEGRDGCAVLRLMAACDSGRQHAWWRYLPVDVVRGWAARQLRDRASGLHAISFSALSLGLLYTGNVKAPPQLQLGQYTVVVPWVIGEQVRREQIDQNWLLRVELASSPDRMHLLCTASVSP